MLVTGSAHMGAAKRNRRLAAFAAVPALVVAAGLATALHADPAPVPAAGEAAATAVPSPFLRTPAELRTGLPAGATAYASADPDAAVAVPSPLPAPDAAVAPAAPVPPVPDPGRALGLPGGVDGAALRQALDAYRRGRLDEGDRLRDAMTDAPARAVLDWAAIRAGATLSFTRVANFLRDNPDWPAGPMLRRRAEETLLIERRAPAVVRAFFATRPPTSAPGRLALALAFRAEGLDEDAAALVRQLWREDTFGREFEARVLDAFPGVLGEADHRVRMERALFKESWEAAGRAAAYAGKGYATLVRARRAVEDDAKGAQAALDAVPPSLRTDSSFLFAKAHLLRRQDKAREAAAVVAQAPRNPDVLADPDEWWTERRVLARKLLDVNEPRLAYAVASASSARSTEKRIEAEFHAGWIALRFLDDPRTAAGHFAQAAGIAETPISIARAAYWQGRAADALGEADSASAFYRRAASQPVTYYGQLARARLGASDLTLRTPATLDPAARDAFEARLPVRALRLLDAAGLKDLARPLYIDLANALATTAELDALGRVAEDGRDGRALVAIGKAAFQRGFALDTAAYPTIGIPAYEAATAVLPVEKAMVYAIARQESQFDPRARSGVGASGLMQLMPDTARRTAKRVGLAFDVDRLTGDPAYNAKLGQAHLGELMADWRGSYVLAFASYNAGGGNVKKWIDAYGDPRKADTDPVDWVERIPFTETRNYVQRVMENLQVYRTRLEGRTALVIEADLRRGAPSATP
jgi:soluble lytic murein transglycosylase